MSSAHSMNARKCVHAQKPYPRQAFAHESSKVGGRETGKTEARKLTERKAAQQNKKLSEELKQGLPTMYFIGRVTLFFANNYLTLSVLTATPVALLVFTLYLIV